MFLAYWVHDLNPFIVRFSDNFGIRYYGVAYLLGFVAGAWLLHAYARAGRSLVPAPQIADLIIALVVGVLVGGRLGSYFLYDGWESFTTDPLGVFKVWDGGMASHGGFIGVTIALAWFSRKQRIPFFHLADLIVSVAPLGLFFGRIANFINGELWGKITTVPWAVIFPLSAPAGTPVAEIAPRHPSQLYELFMEGFVLFTILWTLRKRPLPTGTLFWTFVTFYGLFRIVAEQFREPDPQFMFIIPHVSAGMILSGPMFLLGLTMVLIGFARWGRSLPAEQAA